MYESFEKLSDDKKIKLLNIILDEFVEKGYENASTNTIVKNAGISKGLLFHYFGNKQDMFLYLVDWVIKEIYQMTLREFKGLQGDIFERILQGSQLKMKIARENIKMYKLLYDVYLRTPEKVKAPLQERFKMFTEMKLETVYGQIEEDKLREGVTPKMACQLILYFVEGYNASFSKLMDNIKPEEALNLVDEAAKEIQQYFKILRKGIFKD
ncbi:MAG: TetR/AcrR family transcriptional regulator [Clostridia bacterium]|nr:TetR/AcrR family transcriptional regulator [Clostridia bacterium]